MGKVIVYTDGAAKNNNESLSMEEKCRYCGWAYKITDERENKCDIQSGGEQNKTNYHIFNKLVRLHRNR